MSKVKVIAAAGDQVIANEILSAVKQVLGATVEGQAYSMNQVNDAHAADLFICVSSRKNALAQKIPVEKVVGIDMVPCVEFFIELAKLAPGCEVYVFNNSSAYANKLVEYCHEVGIDHLKFQFIAYDELSEGEIESSLKQAAVIMGIENIVGPNGILHSKFEHHLNAGAKIIAAKRVTNIESACELMKWITLFNHKHLADKVTIGTNKLTNKMQQITAIAQEMSNSLEEETASFTGLSSKLDQGMNRLAQVKGLSETLAGAARNIGNIVDAIKHISGQTNLLALNATIEAARVGEAGRGFAVVAREVGKLAAESQKSTETIRSSIQEIQAVVSQITPALAALTKEMSDNQHQFSEMSQEFQRENQSIIEIFKAMESIQAMSEELLETTLQLTKSA